MEIIIDNIDFWNIEAARYWSFPKSTSIEERKSKAREMCLSTRYLGARKMDGAWNMLIKDLDGNFHLRSRKESVNGGFTDKAEWIPQITAELDYLPNGTVLIGEIYLPNDEGSRKITSILNCLKDKSLSRQKEKPLHFYVFDAIAACGIALNDRSFEERISILGQMKKDSTYVQIAEYKEGAELWELYHNVLFQGGEGIVITRKDYTYEFGKRTAWKTLKMKKELQDTIDAFVDGAYKPATQQYNGKAVYSWNYWYNQKTQEKLEGQYYQEYINGKPIIPVTKAWFNDWATAISFSVYKDNKPVHIGWISGITDEIKQDIVFAPEKLINKVAELTAMEVEQIDGNYSLRHGRILQFRDDKQPEDCLFEQIVNSKN